MAILTPLSLEDAHRIGALYGLEVSGVRGILAGSVNSNYALTLANGRRQVFLRVYEEQQAEAAANEARMLAHLCAGGVATPRPLRRVDAGEGDAADAFIAAHSGKPVALFPWVAGDTLCQARVTPAATRQVGAALARVHLVGASYESAAATRFDLDNLEQRLCWVRTLRSAADANARTPSTALAGAALNPEVERAVDELSARLERIRAEAPSAPIHETLIHGDLFRDNVLWNDGAITALLDFESASRGSAAFDLAVTMLAWCFGDTLSPELAAALGEGYSSVRPLSADECDRLFYDSACAALRFSITRITDFELRPKGSGVYKDFRRFLARQRALERLGSDGLLTVLRL